MVLEADRLRLLRPEPAEESSAKPNAAVDAVAAFYNGFCEVYHLIYKDWRSVIDREANVLSSLFESQMGWRQGTRRKVLDCAAGVGTQAIGAARMGHAVVASDVSTDSLRQMRRHFVDLGIGPEVQARISYRRAEFRELKQLFAPASFDAVLCMDNAVAHTESREHLRDSIESMTQVTKHDGCVVLSLRPYDEILRSRPALHPPRPVMTNGRMYFQIWEWTGSDRYNAHFFIVTAKGETYHRTISMRAVLLEELTEVCQELGYATKVLAETETGYFQPIVVIYR